MTHRPVRSLAALLAVLMVLFAFPALPIFAAENQVKNITVAFSGISGKIYLFDGNKAFPDQAGQGLVIDASNPSGTLTLGSTEFTVKPGEGGGVTLEAQEAPTVDLKLGIATNQKIESMDYSVDEQEINGTVKFNDVDYAGYLAGSLTFVFNGFVSSAWNQIQSDSIKINFSVPTPTHSVTFAGDKASYTVTKINDTTVTRYTDFSAIPEKADGNKFEFTVDEKNEAKAIFSIGNSAFSENISLEAGEVEKGKRTYTFTVSEDAFKDDITITITVTPITYNIKFSPKDLHAYTYDVSYNGDATAVYDGRFQFTVTPHLGYGAPAVELAEKANAKMSKSSPTSDGSITYSITEIKGDITVNIKAGKEEKYAVNVIDGDNDGYTVNVTGNGYENNQATGGASLSIAVTVGEGYTNSSPTVSVDGVQLTGGSKKGNTTTFTYTMPYRAITITVGSVAKNTYTVTPPQSGAGYTVSPSIPMTVAHGDTAVFTVTLQPGFEHKATNDDLKDLFKDSSGIESVVYNEDSATFTVTIIGTQTKKYEIADQKIVAITYTVSELSHGTGYSFSCTQGSVGYNNAATFTVKPDTGYYITGIEYTVGDDATWISLGANNVGNFSYSILNVQGNIKVKVTCVAITVKVTYIYPNVDFYGLTITGSNVKKEYTIGGIELVAGEGELKFKPEDPDSTKVEGLVFGGWQYNNVPVSQEGLELSASQCNGNGEISITLTAKLSAKISDRPDENSDGEQEATVYVQDNQKNYDPDLKNIQLSGSVKSALDAEVLAKLSGEIKVLRVGTVYARNDSLSDETLRTYQEKIKGMTSADFVDGTNPGNSYIYAYVHSAVNFNLNESTYTQRINLSGVSDEKVTRYGCMFFVIEIKNQTYIFFGQIHMFNIEISASED